MGDVKRRKQWAEKMNYSFNETCATDGLCAIACPVGINTGKLVKELRWKENGKVAKRMAEAIANHMDLVTATIRNLMKLPHAIARITGYGWMESVARGIYRIGDGLLPLWTRYTPTGSRKICRSIFPAGHGDTRSGLFPLMRHAFHGRSCFRVTGSEDVPSKMISVLRKAGYTVIIPDGRRGSVAEWRSAAKGFAISTPEGERVERSVIASKPQRGVADSMRHEPLSASYA